MSNFNPEQPILQKTEDGSHTLYLPTLDETYHSATGALTESNHVYINHGFNCINHGETIKILEVGFGTGMNAILTFEEAQKQQQKVVYESLEPFPISPSMIQDLDMGYISKQKDLLQILTNMHTQQADLSQAIGKNFMFTRWKTTIQEFNGMQSTYDLIYYDAFAPRKQPEMWDYAVLEKCVWLLKTGGIFITYCANGQFKRNMKALGMALFNPPGIGPRREITQAQKK